MAKQPLSVTLLGWLFIAAGVVGLAYHSGEYKTLPTVQYALVCSLRLLAVAGGAFLLLGRNWARWLLLAWMALHVAISLRHTPAELIVHVVFLVLLVALLFRPRASAYFRRAVAPP